MVAARSPAQAGTVQVMQAQVSQQRQDDAKQVQAEWEDGVGEAGSPRLTFGTHSRMG